jgi:putative ubiquitin-RnfH superfamily antitoxin RatB of RatAB toxin-antitoxin module
MVQVEVVYVDEYKKIFSKTLELPVKSLVKDALEQSGVYQIYEETKLYSVGIFSKTIALNEPLFEGARIEIYRPLMQDPKEKRRIRAKKQRLKNAQS